MTNIQTAINKSKRSLALGRLILEKVTQPKKIYEVFCFEEKGDKIIITYSDQFNGAYEAGVKSWMQSVFNYDELKSVLENGIRADKLLPILKSHHAYGLDRFKSLITF